MADIKFVKRGEKILITGVNGFIAHHVANEALQRGLLVRGTVRGEEKGIPLQKLFDEKYGRGKFEYVVVKEMAEEGAFDEAIKGIAGVAHVASVLTFSPKYDEVVPTVVDGTLSLLRSAAREPSVKRFLITSTANSGSPIPKPDRVLDGTTWNEESPKLAGPVAEGGLEDDDPTRPMHVYAASKIAQEKAALQFVEENKPGFVLNAILPNINFGPKLDPSVVGSSWIFPVAICNGQLEYPKMLGPEHFSHVSDTGILHVLLLTSPAPPYSTTGTRIWAVSGPCNFNEVLQELRILYPSRTFCTDEELPDTGRDLGRPDTRAAVKLLKEEGGRPDGFRGLREAILDNTKGFI